MSAALNAIPLLVFEVAMVIIAGTTALSALYLVALGAMAIWGER